MARKLQRALSRWRRQVAKLAGMKGSECGGRILGATGEGTPRVEARGKLLAIERGAQQMALEGEVLTDGPEAR